MDRTRPINPYTVSRDAHEAPEMLAITVVILQDYPANFLEIQFD